MQEEKKSILEYIIVRMRNLGDLWYLGQGDAESEGHNENQESQSEGLKSRGQKILILTFS